jgi:hypothetical protein
MAKLEPDSGEYQAIARILRDSCGDLRPDSVLFMPMANAKMVQFWPTLTQRGLRFILHDHVSVKGKVMQVRETREQYKRQHEFHYDFECPAPESSSYPRIYVECRLDSESRDSDRWTLLIVSIHPPNKSNP